MTSTVGSKQHDRDPTAQRPAVDDRPKEFESTGDSPSNRSRLPPICEVASPNCTKSNSRHDDPGFTAPGHWVPMSGGGSIIVGVGVALFAMR